MASKSEIMGVLRKLILELFPWMKGYHAPIRAKVVKVHEAGGRSNEFGPKYSADVQPLKNDWSEDDKAPIIPDVEIPVIWAGPNRGIFCLPEVGSVVRVGFYFHDPAQPFIDAVLAYGYSVPEHPLGSLIIQHSNGVKIEITEDKDIVVKTTENKEEEIEKEWSIKAETAVIEVKKNAHVKAGEEAHIEAPKVHLAGGGSPIARVGDEVLVVVGSGSSAGSWTGTITKGSDKSFSG